MNKTLVLCVLLVAAVDAKAHEVPARGSAGQKPARDSEARIQTLEQQVSMLAEQVALLRGQLKVLADSKAPGDASVARLVLASAPAPSFFMPRSASWLLRRWPLPGSCWCFAT